MCLPTYSSVFNLMCLCEYLETMVTGAIEIERAGRWNIEREDPKHQGAGRSVFVTPVFILSWQEYLSCLCAQPLPWERKCHPLPYVLTSSWSPEEERRYIQCIRIHIIITTSYLCVTCHFSVHVHAQGSELTFNSASLSGLPSAKIGLCNDGNSKQVGPMASAFWPVSFRLECAVWSDLSHGVTAGTSQKTVMGCRKNFANFMSRDKGKGKP